MAWLDACTRCGIQYGRDGVHFLPFQVRFFLPSFLNLTRLFMILFCLLLSLLLWCLGVFLTALLLPHSVGCGTGPADD